MSTNKCSIQVKNVNPVIPVPPPIKKYTITFNDLTQEELVYLRASVSDCKAFRERANRNAHVIGLHHSIDMAYSATLGVPDNSAKSLYDLMEQQYPDERN